MAVELTVRAIIYYWQLEVGQRVQRSEAVSESKRQQQQQQQAKAIATFLMKISDAVNNEFTSLIANRRHFHKYPELAYEEHKTAAHVVDQLKQFNITNITTGVGGTGVVAYIYPTNNNAKSRVVALRADMDALPLQETSTHDYASVHPNKMHACGHDLHVASLLTTAKLLASSPDSFNVTVKLIFQPAEEGRNGAGAMVDDNVMDDVDSIYGIHVWSDGAVGEIQVSDGPVMASVDRFDIDIRGKGGHGAAPHQTVDAIVTSANIITNLQTIVSRNVAPTECAVVTCGEINGGANWNIIADVVKISGTTRAFKPEIRERIKDRMRSICACCGEMGGGSASVAFSEGIPATINKYPANVEVVREAARVVVGEENIKRQYTMGG